MEAVSAFLSTFWSELWHILLESGVWLVLGLALAGLVHAFVPRSWFTRHLGGRGVVPIAKASLLGIPMPLCSCSVIPVAAGLRRQGAGKGATAAFAISTPQTGEESIPITWALFGPVFALARPIIAVITAFLAGLAINAADREPRTPPEKTQPAPPLPEPPSPPPPPKPLGEKLQTARVHGFGTMLRDLAPWLAWGILAAALIGAAVPEGWIAEHVGTGLWPKVLMLFIGIPIYICATSSTPLAWSLVMAGLSPGAAIVLLLVGPAVNVATMSWVIKDLGVKVLAIYISVIAAVALVAGTIFDAFFAHAMVLAEGAGATHAAGGPWAWAKAIGAVLFLALLANALYTRFAPKKTASCCAAEPAAPSCCGTPKPDVPLPAAPCCGGSSAPSCGCPKD
ncbi:MAG: SO_0444 family Cu/Zn efflux transporter [Phycisphaerales bacterium]|nr:SO_0444 family Cu/Zn efflux transporter [Planctomycetota bacterium]MCH8507984.1 SO_0444 family Cu/Zn efflux transporter [Phycisphaerales bacterium]